MQCFVLFQPVPYHAQLDKFLQTNRMRIVGKPLNNPQRFTVNLISANGEVLFHFNPRFEVNNLWFKLTKIDWKI